ncbi:hypothetical protein H6776_00800, partial [Candidatus Nomurabacteria bacterium]|nr:hypothetical protein [Candidatus Nomurabacteria bacterium]
ELSGRLEYRDFPNGEQRPWVWIYPGEILNVPTYFSNCAGLQIQGSQKVDYYYPTALSVRVVEPSPGLNSQKILVLDEGYRSSPKQAEQKGYGDSTLPAWFWNIGKWLLALGLLLAVILILFWMLSQLWEAISNSSGNQTPSAAPAAPDNNIEGRQCVTESQTDDIAIIGALTKHLEQLQMTGGKSNISVGENIHAEFEIPNPVEPEFTLLIVEIDNEKVENKKKK